MKKRTRRQQQSNLLPLSLIIIGAALVLGLLVWQIFQGGSTAQTLPNNAPQQNANIPEPGVARVSLADARSALAANEAVFLDVRDPDSFQAGHVPGAVNIPISQLENRASELDPNAWIITYCT